jgi:hypothetical protein
MPKIIARKEALAKGLKGFFTGKPCKRGHMVERRVDTGGLRWVREPAQPQVARC